MRAIILPKTLSASVLSLGMMLESCLWNALSTRLNRNAS